MTRHFILATAGHESPARRALVQALTGVNPNCLPEDQAGIGNDHGLVHFEVPAPASLGQPGEVFSVGMVSLPGHGDSIKGMAAGFDSIDLALLVVAADDGWLPQTEEHLQILTYLGVTRAVVALTEADLAAETQAEAVGALSAQLSASPFAGSPIVPTSLSTRTGTDGLRSALAAALADLPGRRDIGKPRLPVDGVFGSEDGTVVTGTLIGGPLRDGQELVLQPGDRVTRVGILQNHSSYVEHCPPGRRIAVTLPNLQPRSESHPDGVARGDVLALPGLGSATSTLDVQLGKSARLLGQNTAAGRPLKNRTQVRLHLGTTDVSAVVFLHGGELVAGDVGFAQLRCEAPVYAFAGDRFILRAESEPATLAGGLVLDPDGDRKHWQVKPQLVALAARAQAPADPGLWLTSQLARDGVVPRAGLLAKTGFSAAEIEAVVTELVEKGRSVVAGEFVADGARWRSWQVRAAEIIDRAHRLHPEWSGLLLTALWDELEDELALPGAFASFVVGLGSEGFVVNGSVIRRVSHRPSLPPRLEATGSWLRGVLAEKPLEPPSRKELVPDRNSEEVLRFLIETGEAVEVGEAIVLAAPAYARAVDEVKAFLRQREQATMSELRQALGSSRRIVIPLCEKLDRDGITSRLGDYRRLGPNG